MYLKFYKIVGLFLLLQFVTIGLHAQESKRSIIEGAVETLQKELVLAKDISQTILMLKENRTYFYTHTVDSSISSVLLKIAALIEDKFETRNDQYWLIRSLYAHNAYSGGNFNEALSHFENIIQINNPVSPLLIDLKLDAAKYSSFVKKIEHEPQVYKSVQKAIECYRMHNKTKELADYLLEFGQLLIQSEPLVVFDMANYALNLYQLEPAESVINEIINANSVMGQTMLMAGRIANSIDYYYKALQYAEKHSNSDLNTHIEIYKSIARLYSFSRNTDSASFYILKLKEATEKHPNPSTDQLTGLYSFLSRFYADKQMFDSALIFRNKVISIDKKGFPENSHRIKSSYYALSTIYMQQGNYNKALEFAHKNLTLEYPEPFGKGEIFDTPPLKMYPGVNVNAVLQNLMQKIYLQECLYDETGDIKWLKNARDHYYVVDFMTKNLQESMLDKNFLALLKLNTTGYQAASKTIAKLYYKTKDTTYLNDLYFFSTALKGRYLAFQQYQLNLNKENDEPGSSNYSRVYNQINDIKSALKITADPNRLKELNDSLLDLNIQISLMKQEQQQNVSESNHKFDVSIYHASAETLKQKIDKNTALVEYVVLNDSLHIFTFTNNNLYLKTIPAGAEYTSSLADYRKRVMTGGDLSSTSIGNYLIEPIYSLIKEKSNLIIIPDDNLFAIPIESIVLKSTSQNVINQFNVSYHYSGYFWYRSFTKTVEPQNPSIALFAPVFDQESNGILASSNPYRDNEMLIEDSVLRGSNNLQPLPFSCVEVEQISKKFESKKLTARVFLREQASEQNFRESENATIVHIATHGVSNKYEPEQSGLFFSQDQSVVSKSDFNSDGFLHMNELYALSFNTDLTVLSACKSGAGQIVEGEGFFGLPRGFILAGANNLIVSLWKLHDEKTASLIKQFYDYLLKGNNYAQSLRLAKIDMINDGYLPVDWSGLILIGK